MKKILSLTGIAALATILATSSFAGNSIEQQVDRDNTSMLMEPAEKIGLTDTTYSQYDYSGRRGHQGGHQGKQRGRHNNRHNR